jgi:hypothetical protein
MQNLHKLARQIATAVRPPSAVTELETVMDQITVLRWAQRDVTQQAFANTATLMDIEVALAHVQRPRPRFSRLAKY